ncbi:MAG: dihydropteroate synthase [Clostridia bacterium]|nr:dihydropteroate synthase [Clostridia bacterium]
MSVPLVMGIVNVTPDSFSDGGRYFEPSSAYARARKLHRLGTDIIDLGAMSTGPGSEPITSGEELGRLRPVLELLADERGITLSVDTIFPETADVAAWYGVKIVNDVSGVLSEEMAQVVVKRGLTWVVTHNPLHTASAAAEFEEGVTADIRAFFARAAAFCAERGIPAEKLIFDPGFGFSKNKEQNMTVLKNLDSIKPGNGKLLIGLSRKRFLDFDGKCPSASRREARTLCANLYAAAHGADILRVHDAEATLRALELGRELQWTL